MEGQRLGDGSPHTKEETTVERGGRRGGDFYFGIFFLEENTREKEVGAVK